MAWRGPRHLETEGGRGDLLKKAKLDWERVFQRALRPGMWEGWPAAVISGPMNTFVGLPLCGNWN